MAFTEFTTDNANYVLVVGEHFRKSPGEEKLAGIDALVMEYPYQLSRSSQLVTAYAEFPQFRFGLFLLKES